MALWGWCVGEGLNTREARWFSLRLDPGSTPWVFEKGIYKVIASLELLAVLTAVMVFVPYLPPGVVGHAAFGCSAGNDRWQHVRRPEVHVHEVPVLHSIDGALFPVGGARATSWLGLAPKRGQPACRCFDQWRLLETLSRKNASGSSGQISNLRCWTASNAILRSRLPGSPRDRQTGQGAREACPGGAREGCRRFTNVKKNGEKTLHHHNRVV